MEDAFDIFATYYEAENINLILSKMNEKELESEYANNLMLRLAEIKELELTK